MKTFAFALVGALLGPGVAIGRAQGDKPPARFAIVGLTHDHAAGRRVCAKIDSERCRRDFGGPRGASDEHIQGICEERATKRGGKRTRQVLESIFAQTLAPKTRNRKDVELAGNL
jgi:hypothetical protein